MEGKTSPLRVLSGLPYLLLEKVGSGSFGEVFRVQDERTQQEYALKRISKLGQGPGQLGAIELSEEVVLEHKNITKIIDKFQTLEHNYLLMELMRGGTLRHLLLARGEAGFSEVEVAHLALALLDGIAYLHRLHIIHRDIKPENILFAREGSFASAKLADFGLCAYRYDFHELNKFKGTPAYMAPEVFQKTAYNKSVDLWSLGAVLFEMLSQGRKLYQVYQLHLPENRAKFNFQSQPHLSESANEFLGLLLTANPKDRPQPYQMTTHRFITERVREQMVLPYSDSVACFEDKMLIVRALKAVLMVKPLMRRTAPPAEGVKNFIIRKSVNIVERHLQMLKSLEKTEHQPKKVVSFKEEVPVAQFKADTILQQFRMIGPRQFLQSSKSDLAEGADSVLEGRAGGSKETSDSLRQVRSQDKVRAQVKTWSLNKVASKDKVESGGRSQEASSSQKRVLRLPRKPPRARR